ncbi:hypothetical protein MMC18_007077 [Xylographa bjoerkii]|nr:hypothetical protein [Xylographa bjoerkii]
MGDKRKDVTTTNGCGPKFRVGRANMRKWLDEESKEAPWTIYRQSNQAPIIGQADQLQSLEAEMERDEERVQSRDSVTS